MGKNAISTRLTRCTGWLRNHAADVIGAALVALLLLAIHLRILTYVTGQDPFTYTRLAQDLLAARFSLDELVELSRFIVPGFPVLLAGVLFVAGPFAVAWLNLLLLILVFLMLARLLRRWGFPAWAPLIVAWTTLWLALPGGSLNPHFLLYAFRGPAQFLFILAAYSLVDGATPATRRGGVRLALASGLLLLGALVRETTLLAGPALLLWVWLSPDWRSARGRGTCWLAAPVLLAGLAAGLAALALDFELNLQAGAWLASLLRGGGGAYWGRLTDYLRLLVLLESGWIVLALCVPAVWHLRDRLHIVLLWVAPALLWILFYAGYSVHRRFLLDSLFLLAILSGIGAWQVTAQLMRACGRRFARAVLVAAAALLLGLNLYGIQHTGMWGPRVSRRAVLQLLATVDAHAPASGRVVGDVYCPYIVETLWIYGGIRSPRLWEEWGRDGVTAESLLVLSEGVPIDDGHGINTLDAARALADVEAMVGDDGEPVRVRLDQRTYVLYQVAPWSAPQTREPVRAEMICGGLLWLDFQRSDPAAEREAVLLNAAGEPLRTWSIGSGNGLIPLRLEPGWLDDGPAWLEVQSSAPLPARLTTTPLPDRGRCSFFFASGRTPSALQWVGPPAHRSGPSDKWGAVFTAGAAFSVPLPRGMMAGDHRVVITLEPRFGQAESVEFRYRRADGEVVAFTSRLDRGRIYHVISQPAPFTASVLELDLEVDVPEDWPNHFRLIGIGGRAE